MTQPRWILALVVLLLALAAERWLAFGAANGGDWAQYMSHARALAEGRPYGEIGYLFSPAAWVIGPPVYPPGLPLLLLPSVAALGESTLVPRLLMHALLGLFLWSAYRTFAGDEPKLALAMVALLGTRFLLADTPNVIGADLGMGAFIWFAIALADGTDRWTVRLAVAVCVLGVFALLFRIAALPLVPAIGLWALIRWRTAGIAPWLIGVVWAATLVWMLAVFGPGGQATQAFSFVSVPGDLTEPDGTARFFERLARRLGAYRYALWETYLYPIPFRVGNHVYHLLAVPVTAIGLWGWIRPRWSRFSVLFAAMTVCMLMTIPVWTARYAWVIAPFACYGLARGIAWLAGRGRRPQIGSHVALLVCLTIAIMAVALARPGSRGESDADDWRAVGTVLAEVAAPEVRVASNRPRVMAWYTRIPAMGLPAGTVDVFLSEARRLGVTHLVVTRRPSEERAFVGWEGWKRERPDLFRLVHTEGDIEVYEISLFEP